MNEFITRPFVTVIVTFVLLSILIIVFNTKLKQQREDTVSSKWIVLIEFFFDFFSNIVRDTLGEQYIEKFTPLAVTMFGSVFLGNVLCLIGLQESATDIMFPLTWTLLMFVFWNGYGIYKAGIKHFVGDFFQPMWWMFPLEIIGFFTKPLTLMIRMFGNITSGFIMMGYVLAIPSQLAALGQLFGVIGLVIMVPITGGLSFYFSVFEPFIQATVFTYLVFVNLSLLIKEEE